LEQVFLSNIELYYSSSVSEKEGRVILEGDEFRHSSRVMRNSVGDSIHITDGGGKIFRCLIRSSDDDKFITEIEHTYQYVNRFEQITFVLPRMKNSDRFETALEKCVELGITNFIVFQADRSIAKGGKLQRWNKIALSAMKQSLNSFKPELLFIDKLDKLKLEKDSIPIFLQQFGLSFKSLGKISNRKIRYYFIFGPEGGLTEREISLFDNSLRLKLADNRLRSETAIITAAVKLPDLLR